MKAQFEMERKSAADTQSGDEGFNPYAPPSLKEVLVEEVKRSELDDEPDYFWIIWGVGVAMASVATTLLLIWSTNLLD